MTTTRQPAAPPPGARKQSTPTADFGAQWAEAAGVYTLYAALAKEFKLGASPFGELQATDQGTPELFGRVARWLDEMDQRVQVQQLRQYLQTCQVVTEEGLRALTHRHLQKPKKSPSDRDKIDFLLVQYFALCAPEGVFSQDVGLADVAQVLRPVLGDMGPCPLDWFEPLDQMLEALRACQSLRDLLERGFLEQSRRLKDSAGDMLYDPSVLVAFARFNFLLRRSLIRLMNADLRAIRGALAELEAQRIRAVDCRGAGLSATESTAKLLQVCESWKQPFRMDKTDYALGPTFERLLAIRAAVEEALAQPQPRPSAETIVKDGEAKAAPSLPKAPEAAVPPARESSAKISTTPGTAKSSTSPASSAKVSPPPPSTTEIEDCLDTIWEQLIAAPPGRGRSMSTVALQGTRVLLNSWEVAAFVSDGGSASPDIRQAVVARALLAVAIESSKRSGYPSALEAMVLWAQQEIAKLQARVDQAQGAKDTETAVNLGISVKRLMAFIEQAEGLRSLN